MWREEGYTGVSRIQRIEIFFNVLCKRWRASTVRWSPLDWLLLVDIAPVESLFPVRSVLSKDEWAMVLVNDLIGWDLRSIAVDEWRLVLVEGVLRRDVMLFIRRMFSSSPAKKERRPKSSTSNGARASVPLTRGVREQKRLEKSYAKKCTNKTHWRDDDDEQKQQGEEEEEEVSGVSGTTRNRTTTMDIVCWQRERESLVSTWTTEVDSVDVFTLAMQLVRVVSFTACLLEQEKD